MCIRDSSQADQAPSCIFATCHCENAPTWKSSFSTITQLQHHNTSVRPSSTPDNHIRNSQADQLPICNFATSHCGFAPIWNISLSSITQLQQPNTSLVASSTHGKIQKITYNRSLARCRCFFTLLFTFARPTPMLARFFLILCASPKEQDIKSIHCE